MRPFRWQGQPRPHAMTQMVDGLCHESQFDFSAVELSRADSVVALHFLGVGSGESKLFVPVRYKCNAVADLRGRCASAAAGGAFQC